MMLTALLTLTGAFSQAKALPPFSAGLGRAISWDSKGAYALDSDAPLTPTARRIVKDLADSELGRAESLSRGQLDRDAEDLVPAWTLSQVLRVRKLALAEYHRNVEGRSRDEATIPVLLLRLHVCRLADEQMPIGRRRTGDPLWEAIHRDEETLRDRLLPHASRRLGIAISIFETSPFWILMSRKALEDYRTSHPEGPEVRPLLCQADLWGLHLGPRETFLTPKATAPEEPQPTKALGIANALLKERPDDPLGHYYAGVCRFYLHRTDLAVREMKAALATGGLPPTYKALANRFVASPGFAAFTRYKVVY